MWERNEDVTKDHKRLSGVEDELDKQADFAMQEAASVCDLVAQYPLESGPESGQEVEKDSSPTQESPEAKKKDGEEASSPSQIALNAF